jgi:hypothetical protein
LYYKKHQSACDVPGSKRHDDKVFENAPDEQSGYQRVKNPCGRVIRRRAAQTERVWSPLKESRYHTKVFHFALGKMQKGLDAI